MNTKIKLSRALAVWSLFVFQLAACAAPVGKATADFDDGKPDRGETQWGRLVSDALRIESRADIALVNAGALKRGVLKAGPIEAASIDELLTFGDDDVVTITLTGAQLRKGLERAVQAYPEASVAFLHCSGFNATFNPQAPGDRITLMRFNGREVDNKDTFKVAMPISLAEGSAGYFTLWSANGAQHTGASMRKTVIDYIRSQRTIAPSEDARIAPQ